MACQRRSISNCRIMGPVAPGSVAYGAESTLLTDSARLGARDTAHRKSPTEIASFLTQASGRWGPKLLLSGPPSVDNGAGPGETKVYLPQMALRLDLQLQLSPSASAKTSFPLRTAGHTGLGFTLVFLSLALPSYSDTCKLTLSHTQTRKQLHIQRCSSSSFPKVETVEISRE